MKYRVGVYLVHRAYGGPEEGGWWYDDAELDSELALNGSFFEEEWAYEYARSLNLGKLRELNAERPPYTNTNGIGEYRAMVFEDELPPYYPETRPYYE